MAVPQEQKVSEEQAADALQQLLGNKPDESEAPAQTEETAEAEPQETPQEEKEEPEGETQPEPEAATDDLDSLRKRLTDLESEREQLNKASQARVEAIQQRSAENERILRDRYVRKATVTDKLVKALEQAGSESGLDRSEVDRLVAEARATMNPASASYRAPEAPTPDEDQEMVLNNFLNTKGMTQDEASEFGNWMRTDASKALSPFEQAVAGRDLGGFLVIAHRRFEESKREAEKSQQRTDAAAAVKSVQRTQAAAARAASGNPTSAPKKQPAGVKAGKMKEFKDFTPEDISTLVRQSVEQYR